MPYDARKPLVVGKSVTTPKAPVRSRTTAYVAPRLAASPNTGASTNAKTEDNVLTNTGPKVVPSESACTPVKNFLNSNVTPRSSTRKARVDSASSTPKSTPNGTPISSRPTSLVANGDQRLHESPGIHGLGLTTDSYTRQDTSDNTFSHSEGSVIARKGMSPERQDESACTGTDSPTFFYANEAGPGPRRPSQGSISSKSGFVYANGRQELIAKPKAPSQPNPKSKFCYANGAPDSPTGSTRSPSLKSPVLAQQQHAPQTNLFNPTHSRQRSTSPLKEFEVPAQRPIHRDRRSSGISSLSLQTSATKPTVSSYPPKPASNKEPVSGSIHIKTQSLNSFPLQFSDTASPTKAQSFSGIQSPQSLPEIPKVSSPLNIPSQVLPANVTSPSSPLTSPTQHRSTTDESRIDQLNALAANARRERKVLDLEISNSSLLAINRTLEREMRKQKAELRRYRRLTSGGRLSIAPTDRSISMSTTFSLSTGIDSDIEEDFEDDSVMSVPSGEEDLDESDTSACTLSPGAQAARDARRRVQDEKRLRLDLSKHQELLVDSQRMNQSLKRCFGWTEELILEARKALEYRVHVSDVALGGRVLHTDDDTANGVTEARKALLSPTHVYADDVKNLPWTQAEMEQDPLQHLHPNTNADSSEEGGILKDEIDFKPSSERFDLQETKLRT